MPAPGPAPRATSTLPTLGGGSRLRLAIGTIGSVGMWSFVVALPAVQADFGVARGEASLPFTLTMIGFGVGGMLMGRLADRFGIVLPIVLGAIALAAGYLLSGVAANLWQFALAQGLIGFGASGYVRPADDRHLALVPAPPRHRRRDRLLRQLSLRRDLAADHPAFHLDRRLAHDADRRRHHLRRDDAAAGAGAAPPRAGARCAAAGCGLRGFASDRLGVSSNTLMILLFIAGVSCCVAMSMPQVHIVAYCGDLGYGPARGAEMLSAMLGFGLISRVACGFIADRIGGVATLLISSVLQGVALFLYLLFDGLVSLYVISALFGLFQGGIVPMYAIIVREYFSPGEAGTRLGIVLMATLLGMALGGWMSGLIFDLTGSYQAAFLNGLVWNLVNVSIVLWLLMRPGRRLVPA